MIVPAARYTTFRREPPFHLRCIRLNLIHGEVINLTICVNGMSVPSCEPESCAILAVTPWCYLHATLIKDTVKLHSSLLIHLTRLPGLPDLAKLFGFHGIGQALLIWNDGISDLDRRERYLEWPVGWYRQFTVKLPRVICPNYSFQLQGPMDTSHSHQTKKLIWNVANIYTPGYTHRFMSRE